MNVRRRLSIAIITALWCIAIAGCNTIRGMGQDMERAGEKIQEEANEAK